MNEHFVFGTDRTKLRILEYGPDDAPTVVLVHGLSLNAGIWDPVIEPLQDRFHVLVPELRGHGGSDAPDDAGYVSSACWSEDLAATIDLAGPGPVVLVAWSYGGLVATDYLRTHGDAALAGLMLVSPLRKIGSEAALAMLGSEFLATAAGLTSSDLSQAIPAVSAFVDLLRAGAWDVTTRERLLGVVMSVPPRVRATILSRVDDGDDVLAGVAVPTRVIYGSEDKVILPSASAGLADVVGGTTTQYPGVGHTPFAEESERFVADLGEFVASLPAVASG